MSLPTFSLHHSHPSSVPVHRPDQAAGAAPRFQARDTVMHPSEGVCRITALRRMHFGTDADRPYYVLKPALERSSSTVYLPVERGNAVLRRLLNAEEAEALIEQSVHMPSTWVEDGKQRKEAFSQMIAQGDYARLLRMTQDIRAHSAARIAAGKKPCTADETLLSEAERLVHQEFSHALGLSMEETAQYLQRRLSPLAGRS